MLQNIRDRFTGIVAGAVIGVMAVALTVTLVDTGSLTDSSNFAARVNGEEIPIANFREVAQQQVLQQEELTRTEMTPEARQQVERNVLEGMVRNRVVAQYVRDAGYRVGDERVAEHIRSLPAFQVGGKFSSDGYMAALASQNVTPGAFEEERRAALQIEDLQNGLLESSFFTPAEFRRFVVLEGERRQAAFAILDAQQALPGVSVAEEDIKQYYDSHPEKFESEESVALDYVEVTVADVPPASEPGDDELRAAYEASPDRFRTAEQRRARHILVAVDSDTDDAAALKLATDLRARIAAGEDLAALARKYSDDPGSAAGGGDLGWAARGTYVGAFEAALFDQDVNEVSDPVKTEFGYHVIQLSEVRPGTVRSFDEVRGELAEEARARSSQDGFFALTEKMDDAALENPGSLEAVAATTGRPVRHVDRFTRSGGEPFGAERAVIDAAFSAAVLEGGENSPLLEVGEGRAVVLRVTEHRPVKLRLLEEVRAEVESAVRAERAAKLVAERGQLLLNAVRGGGDFAALVDGQQATLRGPQSLSRTAEGVPAAVVTAIFHAARPQADRPVFDGVTLPDGSFAVFRLDAVIPANPEDIPREQRDARKSVLARQAGVAEVTALAMDLREGASVVLAPGLFEQRDGL